MEERRRRAASREAASAHDRHTARVTAAGGHGVDLAAGLDAPAARVVGGLT